MKLKGFSCYAPSTVRIWTDLKWRKKCLGKKRADCTFIRYFVYVFCYYTFFRFYMRTSRGIQYEYNFYTKLYGHFRRKKLNYNRYKESKYSGI